MRGVVFLPDGSRAGPGVRIVAYGGAEEAPLAETACDPAGNFLLDVSENAARSVYEFRLAAAREGLVSVPCVLRIDPGRAERLVFLRLVRGGRIRARIVDKGGRAVPGGVLLVRGRDASASPAHIRAQFSRWTMVLTADDAGVVDVPAPPLKIRVWARRPAGVFGVSIAGRVRTSETLDLGDVAIGGGLAEVLLHIVDERGEPVPDARIRVEFEHACHLAEVGRDIGTPMQYRSDKGGLVSLRFERSRDPVLIGIGAVGHRIVAATLDRSEPRSEHRVVLRRTPGLVVKLRRPDGGGIPAGLEIEGVVHPHFEPDVAPSQWEELLLGVQEPLRKPYRDAVHPARLIAWNCPYGELVPCAEPGVFHVATPEEGSVKITLALPMGIMLHAQADASYHWPTATVSLPPGRIVRITMTEGGSTSPGRALSASERPRVWLVPRSDPTGPATSPRTVEELRTVSRLGCAAPRRTGDTARSLMVWLKDRYRWIEAIFPFKPFVPLLNSPTADQIASALDGFATVRCLPCLVPVSSQRDTGLRVPWPRVPTSCPLRKVTARIRLKEAGFPVAGIAVVIRRKRPPGGVESSSPVWPPIFGSVEYRERTDDQGTATFHLPDGIYVAYIHASASARKRTHFAVNGTDVGIQVDFVGAARWK